MTPKEKANMLLNKYVSIDNDIFCSVNYPYSKQCAIIAVDEIIKELTDLWKILDKQKVFGASNPTTIRIKYYESVKNELQKL